ncbi:MAG: FAD:protein FMN transferase [Alphaproteobacteria bacterium]
MKSCSKVENRRCRPLLGTFVEIAGFGSSPVELAQGIEAAFAAVARVHRLMSFHDPQSDVSRLNREALRRLVRVHPWTWRVLKCAQEFSRNSDGIFDITTGRHLVKWNYLPAFHSPVGTGSWRDIIFERSRRVRFGCPLTIDLGGIAKGFAVDRAVEALKSHGVTAGMVNAGGDLRTFGSRSQVVHIRHPMEPTRIAGAVTLCERAMATSGTYYSRKKHRGRRVSPLLDARRGLAARELISVTVGATDCMTADALTKIVFLLRERAAPLLAAYRADALLLERDGAPAWMFHQPYNACRKT